MIFMTHGLSLMHRTNLICKFAMFHFALLQKTTFLAIDHFRVVCLVAWPLNESEAGVDFVLIDTCLLFLC